MKTRRNQKKLWDIFVKNGLDAQNMLLNAVQLNLQTWLKKLSSIEKADIWQVRLPIACCVWHLGRGKPDISKKLFSHSDADTLEEQIDQNSERVFKNQDNISSCWDQGLCTT